MKPIVLDSVNKSITAVMSGAPGTTNPDFTAHFADHTTAVFTEGANDGVFNGTTPVTLVAAPAASTSRIIKEITISNVDSAPVTIDIFYKNGANSRRIWYGTIVEDGTFTLDGLYDENGALQTTIASIPAHGHTDGTNGGTLSAAAIASGLLAAARGGLNADASAFNGLLKMSGGAASVAVAGTDYLAPGIDHTDISDFNEAVDDRIDALTVDGVSINTAYNDASNTLTFNALTYWRQPVRVVAVSNVDIASAPSSIDGVTLSSGDRVLLTNQSTTHQNGIWQFNGASSALTRPADYAAASTIFAYQGQAYLVRAGTAYTNTVWYLSTSGAITIDTTATAWTKVIQPVIAGGTGADLSATGPGRLIQASSGANVTVIKDNFSGSSAPGTGNDNTQGYAVGSMWWDTTNKLLYACLDASTGAAVWRLASLTATPASVVIQANTVLGADAATIDKSSISGGYSHLKIVVRLRTDRAANSDNVYIRFNGDNAAGNYYSFGFIEAGATAAEALTIQRLAVTATGIEVSDGATANNATANYFAVYEITVYNYALTGEPRDVSWTGYFQQLNTSGNLATLHGGGKWTNTADAISQITLVPVNGTNFKARSTYAIYAFN